MRILHIVHALQECSGVSYFCIELCRWLQKNGHEVLVVCTGGVEYPVDGVPIHQIKRVEDVEFLPDVVHMHGVWDFFMHQAMVWCRHKNYRYLVSPHGCLMPAAMQKGFWKKKAAFHCYLKMDLASACAFHVTSVLEKKACRCYFPDKRINLIPIGCQLSDESELKGRTPFASIPRTALFLSRISPEKGLVDFLKAWASSRTSGWQLIIAGPDWRGHLAEIQALCRRYQLDNVFFRGPVYGYDRMVLYRSAALFVLPSKTENFSVVVCDALANGVPVLTTTGTPWTNLKEKCCGWCVEPAQEAFETALKEILSLPGDTLSEMGYNGRSLVKKEFSWDKIGREIINLYEEINE